MKYEVEIAGQTVAIDLTEEDSHITAIIDNRRYELTLLSPEKSTYTLLFNNHIYEFLVENREEVTFVRTRRESFETRFIDRKKRSQKHSASVTGIQKLIAPMPGRVVQVLKNVDETVESGEAVLIIEAMKMQNALSSPKTGKVKEIKVSPGQTVGANEVLAVIE